MLTQLAKQRKDSVTQYQDAGREDLAEKESQELAIIEEYLPQQLSEAEIEAVVDDLIAQVGASSPKDMGKVMGPAMKQLKGRADGSQVQAIVKSKLGSSLKPPHPWSPLKCPCRDSTPKKTHGWQGFPWLF